MCVYICPAGFYRQNLTNNRTCVSSCLSNYFIDYVSLICVSTCPNGSYAYVNGSCLFNCPTSFYADDALHFCNTTCANGRYRDPTTSFCVSQCPPGYFGDKTTTYTCRLVCSTATEYGEPISRLCLTKANCAAPYIYADDYSRQCVTQCPQSQNTFGVNSTNFCDAACPWGPTLYHFRDPSTQTCVQKCPINPSLYADNTTFTCVQTCPPNYYAVDATRTC